MKRQSALGLVAAFTAAPTIVRAQAATTIRLGVIPAEPAAEAFYGIDMGFFKKQGIDVDLQVMNSGAAMAPPLPGAPSM